MSPLPCASGCQMTKGKLVFQCHCGLCTQMQIPWGKVFDSLLKNCLEPEIRFLMLLFISWKGKHKIIYYIHSNSILRPGFVGQGLLKISRTIPASKNLFRDMSKASKIQYMMSPHIILCYITNLFLRFVLP